MAKISRADRKRINARSTQSATSYIPEVAADVVATVAATPVAAESKLVRTTRRVSRADQPVDYTAEYAVIGHDLRRIAFWGGLLIVAVIALGYAGLV